MEQNWNIQQLLNATQEFLSKKKIESPRLVAELLLAHILGTNRVYLFSHFDEPIGQEARAAYRAAILRCAKGEPVAYITGMKEFMSLPFYVTPDTLIPRPDTEALVETALQLIEKHDYHTLCDVGTGSGCIPISIAHYASRPLHITALDISAAALRIAQKNAERHQVKLHFLQGNLLAPLQKQPHSLELITANLPYVPLDIYRELEPTVRDFEPRMALTDEKDGLSLYRRLLQQADILLTDTGRMLWEIDPRQADCLDFITQSGFTYQLLPDLAGRNRVVCIVRQGVAEDVPHPAATRHLVIHPEKPDIQILKKAADIIRSGDLVAFPTETVYGLGACYRDEQALAKIFTVKGRPQESPLLVAIANPEQLALLTEEVPPLAQKLMQHFWPGSLSIILPSRPELPAALKNAQGGVGVRMPANRVALQLIALAGPISAPSANLHGRPSPTEGSHVLTELNGKIPLVLDAGRTPGGIESTLIDCTVVPPQILRLGAVSRESIEAVLGMPVACAMQPQPHYQLHFQVLLCPTEENWERKREILRHFHRPYGTLSFDTPDEDEQAVFCGCQTPQQEEADWFALLREAEATGLQTLLVHPFAPFREQFSEGLQARMLRVFQGAIPEKPAKDER